MIQHPRCIQKNISRVIFRSHVFQRSYSFSVVVDQKSLVGANIQQYCAQLGYPLETHQIKTSDGYLLTFHRINKQLKYQEPKRPVYLQHGLLDSSFNFIANEPDKAPGLVLADEGYDVWLGNSRGNHFSLNHESLDWNGSTAKSFWNFSWQQMSQYDLPAAFEYISNHTRTKHVDYIGHSQGTSIMFGALADQDPIVTSKLGKFIAMGPVAFVTKAYFGGISVAKSIESLKLLRILGVEHLPMPSSTVSSFLGNLSENLPSLAALGNEIIANTHPELDNLERFPVFMSHYPDTTSIGVLEHWDQLMKQKIPNVMSKYDYQQKEKNMTAYGQETAPAYDLSKIKHRVEMIVGEYDKIADPEDAQMLFDKLQNVQMHTIKAGHATFLWAKDFTFFKEIVLPTLAGKEPTGNHAIQEKH